MDNKQLAILSNPLNRILNLIEDQQIFFKDIHSILKIDLKKASIDNSKELKKQTVLLQDIKDLLKDQIQQKETSKSEKSSKIKMPSMMGGVGVGLAIVTMAAALVVAAGLFSIIPVVSPIQLLTALAIGAIFVILTPIFVDISKSLNKIKLSNGKQPSGNGIKDMWQIMGASLVTMVGISAAVAMSSWALQMIMPITMEKAGTAILISVMMFGLSISFINIINAFRNGKIKPDANGVKTIGMVGIAMVSLSVAVALSSWALQMIIPVDPEKLYTAFLIGITMIPISFAFALIVKSLKKTTNLKQIALAAAAIPLIAVGLSLAAHVFNYMLPDTYKAPPTEWILLAGFTVAVFALSFYLTAKAVQGLDFKQLVFAAGAIPLIAIAVVGVALIFSYLDNVGAYITPPIDWVAKAALSIFLFSIPFALISIVISKFNLGYKKLILGMASVIAISLAIVGVAYIFQLFSFVDEFMSPPSEWVTAAALSISIFAIPLLAIGFIVGKTGPAALGYGLLGVILIAAAIGIVALIFTGVGNIPGFKGGMQNVVDVLFMPVNAMVDILVRLKEEVGIDNLQPLALGILSIAGAWLILTGAMAGAALGGVVSGVAGVVTGLLDGIKSLLGGEKSKTPFDLLKMLIDSSEKIILLKQPINSFALSFAKIALNTPTVVTGLGAFAIFMQSDKQTILTKSADAIDKIAKGYSTISTASKNMNVAAITATKGMFDALARIANAPKDNPLTTLADELFKAVKELTEVVNNLQGSMSKQSSASDIFTDVIKTVGEKITGVKEKVQEKVAAAPSEATSIDLTPLLQAFADLEDRLNQPLYVIVEPS